MRGFFNFCMVLLVLSNTVHAQNWLWSKPQNITSTNYSKGNIRLGNSGNLVSFLNDNVSSNLTFSDALGDVRWNKYFENVIIKDVIIDSYDNIYFAGSFTGEITISGRVFKSQGNSDAIIGVLDHTGMLLKARTFGGASEESVNSIAMNGLELFTTGHFRDPVSFNSFTLHGDGKNYNTFVLKLDLDLTVLNALETSSEGSSGIKVSVDKYNFIYVLGNANYSVKIGANQVELEGTGQYMAKLNSDLEVNWLRVMIDNSFSGYYKPYMFFDHDANFVLARVSGDNNNVLSIEKFDPLGTIIWGINTKVNLDNLVDMDNNCNIYVAGGYTGNEGAYELSIVKVSPVGIASTIVYNNETMHRVKGMAVTRNKELYVNYTCGGNSLDQGSICEPDVVYMTRYGKGSKNVVSKKSITQNFKVKNETGSGVVVINCNSDKKQSCLLLVKNTLGEIVYLDPLQEVEGNYSRAIDLSSQPKGVYFIEMRSGNESSVEKIVFQ